MTSVRYVAMRLLPLVALGGVVATGVAEGDAVSLQRSEAVVLTVLDLDELPERGDDVRRESPVVKARKASLRKASRRPAPSRSLARSAPESIVPLPGGLVRTAETAAAVGAANAPACVRLCRWLL